MDLCRADYHQTTPFEEIDVDQLPPFPFPSTVVPPTPELKPLPENLKYVFLGPDQTFPVIINSHLTKDQELRLIVTLSEHWVAIGWTILGLRGINPTYCTHKIYLEEGARPSRQM
jgi:hypothetical protein